MKVGRQESDTDPRAIMQMANGYQVSQVLYVATRLNIFTELKDKTLSLQEISNSIKTPLRTTERLLNACCALNLLQKEDGQYHNSAAAEKFLIEGEKNYLGYLIFLLGELYSSWSKLLEVIKKDRPVHDRFAEGREISEEEARFFTLAMHSSSSLSASYLAELIDLSANKKLLDLGGGSGANAIALARRNPQLEVVVYDLPQVIKVAEEFIAQARVAHQVKTRAGDYKRDKLPKGFDCILLSHILHGEGAKGSRILLKECYEILEPSGKIIIIDFLLNENKTGPLFPALFALNMLIETSQGNTFSVQEIDELLKDSGFVLEELKPLGDLSPATAALATKKFPGAVLS